MNKCAGKGTSTALPPGKGWGGYTWTLACTYIHFRTRDSLEAARPSTEGSDAPPGGVIEHLPPSWRRELARLWRLIPCRNRTGYDLVHNFGASGAGLDIFFRSLPTNLADRPRIPALPRVNGRFSAIHGMAMACFPIAVESKLALSLLRSGVVGSGLSVAGGQAYCRPSPGDFSEPTPRYGGAFSPIRPCGPPYDWIG